MRHASASRLALCAVVTGILLGCGGIRPQPPQAEAPPKQLGVRQIIATVSDYSPERWAEVAGEIGTDYGLEQAGQFPLRSIRVQCLVYGVPPERPMADVLARLRADPRVDSVQENAVFEGLRGIHTDPYAGLQYGAQAIGADGAHRQSTGRGIKIAVVDTGIDKSHPDLRGRVIETVNFVEGGEGTFLSDRHGTAVAGVIAARADDVGIVGVAPEAEVVALKACAYPEADMDRALCSSWTIAKALDHAVTAGVQVINMSLGGPPDPLLARLIDAALARGVVVVPAAGSAETPGYPAAHPYVIPVIASDVNGRIAGPSDTDTLGLVAAPRAEILTTAPSAGYEFESGSSLAAAHVSGLVALVLEKQPGLSAREVHALLRDTARRSGHGTSAVGIVNACAALSRLSGATVCL